MTAEVMKTFGTLQIELEQARTNLKDVDEHIKKLLGRDPSEVQIQLRTNHGPGVKRPAPGNSGNHSNVEETRGRSRINLNFNNRGKQNYENDEHPSKKRNFESSVFKRLSERPRHFEDAPLEGFGRNQLISKVIVTPKEVPTRQDILAAQGADEKSKARNRRMFGALLGTLQKFRQEETKLKPKEEKRAQVEKKLEEQQIREREELKKERQDLFLNRKRKQQEIRMIELKMTRLKELAEWEETQRPLMHFIQTKTKPHIYFIPKTLNDQNKNLLETNKLNVEKMIDRKRQNVYSELSELEQKITRNFNPKQNIIDEENKAELIIEDDDVEMKEVYIENQQTEKEKEGNGRIEELVDNEQEDKLFKNVTDNNFLIKQKVNKTENSEKENESHKVIDKEEAEDEVPEMKIEKVTEIEEKNDNDS